MKRLIVLTSLLAGLCFSPWAALATDAPKDKPAAAISTRTIEATLTIDPKLKAWPGLHDSLLAEGKRELNKMLRQSEKDRKETPDMFHDGRRYAFDRAYAERSAIGRYVSVTRADYLDGLGAHPNHDTNTILWDATARKRISIRPFFKESTAGGPTLTRLAHLIRVSLAAEKKARDIEVGDPDSDVELANVQPDLLKMGAVALVPSIEKDKSAGLVFYFSPYAVGAYYEGDYTAFVPWTEFKDNLSAEGAALFGGARPAGDEKND
jgi:hypothetical protein